MNYADEIASYIHDAEYGTWEQRKKAAQKINELNDPEIINILISDVLTCTESVYKNIWATFHRLEPKLAAPVLLNHIRLTQAPNEKSLLLDFLRLVPDPRAVQTLLNLADDPDWRIRCSVAGALGAIGDKRAIPALLKMLDDEILIVRDEAIIALGQPGNEAAIPKLINLFHNLKLPSRSVILRILELLNDARVTESDKAEELLIQALDNKDPEIRAGAAAILKQRPFLGSVIFHPPKQDDNTYFETAQQQIELYDRRVNILETLRVLAINQKPDSPIIQLFIEALKDEYIRVRAKAATILAWLEIPGVLPLLLEELDHPNKTVADTAARELLYESDIDSDLLERYADRNNTLRCLLGRAWVQVWGEKGLEYLIKALGTDDPDIFRETVRALADYGDARAVAPLLEAFGREENRRNEAALEQVIRAFDKYGDATTVPFLLEVQEIGPQQLREMAQNALGHIRERQG